MASSAQSMSIVRYGGPTTAGPTGGNFDALNRILADLCFRNAPKVRPIFASFSPPFVSREN